MAQQLRIGQVARATGVSTRTIRYYEQVGVLPPPRRTAAGYRQYAPTAVERLRFVRRARALGLPLGPLRALGAVMDAGPPAGVRPRLLALVREQMSAVNRRVTELQRLQRQLERVLDRLLVGRPARDTGGCRCLQVEPPPPEPAAHVEPPRLPPGPSGHGEGERHRHACAGPVDRIVVAR